MCWYGRIMAEAIWGGPKHPAFFDLPVPPFDVHLCGLEWDVEILLPQQADTSLMLDATMSCVDR